MTTTKVEELTEARNRVAVCLEQLRAGMRTFDAEGDEPFHDSTDQTRDRLERRHANLERRLDQASFDKIIEGWLLAPRTLH